MHALNHPLVKALESLTKTDYRVYRELINLQKWGRRTTRRGKPDFLAPSQAWIARKLHLARETVTRSISRLRRLGFLRRIVRWNGVQRKSNIYQLTELSGVLVTQLLNHFDWNLPPKDPAHRSFQKSLAVSKLRDAFHVIDRSHNQGTSLSTNPHVRTRTRAPEEQSTVAPPILRLSGQASEGGAPRLNETAAAGAASSAGEGERWRSPGEALPERLRVPIRSRIGQAVRELLEARSRRKGRDPDPSVTEGNRLKPPSEN